MKLYATVASERATKGQGGNKDLTIKVNIGPTKESNEIFEIYLEVVGDKVKVTHTPFHGYDVPRFYEIELPKGEKKKGECRNKDANGNACYDCESGIGYRCGSTSDA